MDDNYGTFVTENNTTAVVTSPTVETLDDDDDAPLSSLLRQDALSFWENIRFLWRTGFLSGLFTRWFLAVMVSLYLIQGLKRLEKTGFSNSVPPIVMSLFKYFMAICTSTSFARVLLFRRHLMAVNRRYLCLALIVLTTHLLTPFAPFATGNFKLTFYCMSDVFWTLCEAGSIENILGENGLRKYLVVFSFWTTQILMFEYGEGLNFSADLVLAISFFVAAASSMISDTVQSFTSSLPSSSASPDQSYMKLVLLDAAWRVVNIYSAWKDNQTIQFAAGLVGSALFQKFFHLTTLDHVEAFFCLLFAWFVNLALTSASDDFGVFNFLLGNAVAGSAISLFGLGVKSWIACGGCVFLYRARLVQKSRIRASASS